MLALFTILSGEAAQARTIRIVALGDSLTAGFGLINSDGFTAKLEAALRAQGWDVTIINAGVSGDTAAGGLARLNWSVPPDADGVIVELGANDMLRGADPDLTRQELSKILERLRQRNLPVLLAGMRAAPNLGAEYGQRFDAIYPDLARSYPVIFYPFFLDGVAGQHKLTQMDGLHPTADGVDVIVAAILPYAEKLVQAARLRAGP